ncbi:methyltransferase domain-containing protein [Breoghania sp.]|uniref:methyltransferase domain-containing protein n=1 Tax=Breoghania sp. TaxID=2065378 RepID=UPI0039EF884A
MTTASPAIANAEASHSCRACGSALKNTLIDLGEQPIANAFLPADFSGEERRFPLAVMVCEECLLVQAAHSISADAIFDADYAYFSSYSDSWLEHARLYSASMIDRFALDTSSKVVEVASNDGYLLRNFVEAGIPALGVEPTANTAQAAIERGVPTHIDFFGSETARLLASQGHSADLMAANNVLAHVPDIIDFLTGFALLLKPEGVVTFEFPHLYNLIRLCQFDTIYHEHFSYLSLVAVEKAIERAGLRVFDVEQLPTHGGSLRVFACRRQAHHAECAGVEVVRKIERDAGMHDMSGYQGLAPAAEHCRETFLEFLERAKSEGATVAAYGAAAKGNTFLNYCGVSKADIACVADRSAAKQGKLLPGSHIPVVAPQELKSQRPDFIVILPWNLRTEIMSDLAFARDWGGRFVIAIPETEIL